MILVTGGTGLVGSHLLYQLVRKKEPVRAIYRNNSNLNAVKKVFSFYTDDVETLFSKIEWMEADLNDIPSLSLAFKGVSHVYHAAAFISFDSRYYFELRKTNIEGTANVVNLCIENNVEKLCYVSSIATLGETLNGDIISEETHWNPEAKNNCYAISKYGAEMEVWRGTQEGIKAIIVCPGVILGAGFPDTGSGQLFSRVQKGMNYYTEGECGFVDVEDVAECMIKLMESEHSNQKYILIGENRSFRKLFSSIAKYLNKPAPQKKLSAFTLNLLRRMDAIRSFFNGKEQVFTKATIDAALNRNYYSNEKIKKDLNISFQPLEKSIETICSRVSAP
ncbi:NAD-dependent epimerase/dehydratase family protein [Leptobacterium flavescens]|uniref:NAD-dependent epimerase/dehydratase family protein n=1 Tax=Leptobacterium flavescens TaxID=472055 RepID=A0A6P0UML8_9FLAO|nr:NAD-dependent epimerase/dehydratase family protein [Leptobacterium flavescens]NER14601.1 NAD-dependent epimerase/dehydratase family protein [Leptobacterium flavescens]